MGPVCHASREQTVHQIVLQIQVRRRHAVREHFRVQQGVLVVRRGDQLGPSFGQGQHILDVDDVGRARGIVTVHVRIRDRSEGTRCGSQGRPLAYARRVEFQELRIRNISIEVSMAC